MSRVFAVVAAVLVAAGPALAADTYVVDKSHSEALFKVRHLVSRVSGRFNDFGGTLTLDPARPEASSVEFTLKAASVDTDNEQRDQHLRSQDFFWAEQHPEISFKSTTIKPAGQDSYEVTGELTMRGVTKTVTLPVEFLGFAKDPWGNEKAGFALSTTLNRKDFGIEWNKTLDQGGYLLSDEVAIEINLEAARPRPAATN